MESEVDIYSTCCYNVIKVEVGYDVREDDEKQNAVILIRDIACIFCDSTIPEGTWRPTL